MAYVAVEWDIDSLVGKAKFVIDKCTVHQDGIELEVDLIRRNCYLSVVSAENNNDDNAVMVDRSSSFRYRTFSFTDSNEDTNIQLKCKIT